MDGRWMHKKKKESDVQRRNKLKLHDVRAGYCGPIFGSNCHYLTWNTDNYITHDTSVT